MGLHLTNLSVYNWRNFSQEQFTFSDGMTILFGKNAAGKTNTIEALQMLTAGFSFRRATPVQQILEGCSSAHLRANLEGDSRFIELGCDIEPGKRRFLKNNKHCQAQSLPQTLMSVLFNPDDLSLVKRSASFRRDEIDGFGRQAHPAYSNLLSTYTRSIEQRNRLLKSEYIDFSLLDAWDASVALGAASLLLARIHLFDRLASKVQEIYKELACDESLQMMYKSSLNTDIHGYSKEELATLYLNHFKQLRPDELRRQQTLVGPQRDDIVFLIDGRDARFFGSQGQQRSIVLAVKMAEVNLAHEIVGEQPLLLLDDVMSELDSNRRDAMTRFVQEGTQSVITTTNLGYFPQELLTTAQVISIGA